MCNDCKRIFTDIARTDASENIALEAVIKEHVCNNGKDGVDNDDDYVGNGGVVVEACRVGGGIRDREEGGGLDVKEGSSGKEVGVGFYNKAWIGADRFNGIRPSETIEKDGKNGNSKSQVSYYGGPG